MTNIRYLNNDLSLLYLPAQTVCTHIFSVGEYAKYI